MSRSTPVTYRLARDRVGNARERHFLIAPNLRQALLFSAGMGWNSNDCTYIINLMQLRGHYFDGREVWWLDRMWPCATHADIDNMNHMWNYARYMCGADLRRWHT